MTPSGAALLLLTALVAALVFVLAFAVLRLGSAVRQGRRQLKEEGAATAFMATALQDAVAKLRHQERASSARAEASERLASEIIASMTSGLLVVGAEGEVRTVNPAGRRLLGLADGHPSGSYEDLLGPGAARLADVVRECVATGRPVVRRTVELRQTGGVNGPSHVGVTVSPIADPAGQPGGAICLFTDLTAIVELEEQLRLKESLARLGELTAGIAHEFRNGLATIHGYGRLLDPERVPPEYRPYVVGIREETRALAEMVANFLNFARPTDLQLSPVDLRAIVDRAAEEIREEAWAKGGHVQVRGEFARVEGDEILLRQAFSNLCRNALEACTEARIAPVIVIEGRLQPDQGWAHVVIRDNGPGINPAALDRVFRPFFTTRAQGTGLGLSLVQKIVVTHGGRVSASNQPEGGARLQVVLPMAPAQRTAQPGAAEVAPA
jgi:two-component system sensor histidine kinase HydH